MKKQFGLGKHLKKLGMLTHFFSVKSSTCLRSQRLPILGAAVFTCAILLVNKKEEGICDPHTRCFNKFRINFWSTVFFQNHIWYNPRIHFSKGFLLSQQFPKNYSKCISWWHQNDSNLHSNVHVGNEFVGDACAFVLLVLLFWFDQISKNRRSEQWDLGKNEAT